MTARTLQRVTESIPTSDGAGVKLRRGLGHSQLPRLDPFLMLDHFSTENPDDYIAGFPHPHRGFETVTYMLDGHLQHQDHLGNTGDLKAGGVQWMTAGRGIIHSEMPQQEAGRMRGFQLWINLPAREKMKPAGYRDIDPAEIPEVRLPEGGTVKVIAGKITLDGHETAGPIQGGSTDPLYLDVELPAGARFVQRIPAGYNALLYTFEGSVAVGPARCEPKGAGSHRARCSPMATTSRCAAGRRAEDLFWSQESSAERTRCQYGPFVMNTREEIEQAIRDYQNGELTGTDIASAVTTYRLTCSDA